MLGTILRYDRSKNYGFVLPDDDNFPDHFITTKFLAADVQPKVLMAGWRVEFDPFDDNGRPQARNVRIISKTIARQVSDKAVSL